MLLLLNNVTIQWKSKGTLIKKIGSKKLPLPFTISLPSSPLLSSPLSSPPLSSLPLLFPPPPFGGVGGASPPQAGGVGDCLSPPQ